MRRVLLLATLSISASCGGNDWPSAPASPAAPAPAPVSTVTFAGTVSETEPTTDTPIAGAEVAILSGPNTGLTAQTNARGAFQMTAAAGQFFIRVRAANYIEHLREVTVNGSGAIAVELDPVFEPVTTTTDLSVSGGSQCPGWWDGFGPSSPCKAVASVDVHHAGPLKARVTWPHKNDVPHIVLYAVESDGVSLEPIDSTEETPHAVSAEVAAHRQYVIHVRMYSFGGGPPSAGPRQFQLTIARPN